MNRPTSLDNNDPGKNGIYSSDKIFLNVYPLSDGNLDQYEISGDYNDEGFNFAVPVEDLVQRLNIDSNGDENDLHVKIKMALSQMTFKQIYDLLTEIMLEP